MKNDLLPVDKWKSDSNYKALKKIRRDLGLCDTVDQYITEIFGNEPLRFGVKTTFKLMNCGRKMLGLMVIKKRYLY